MLINRVGQKATIVTALRKENVGLVVIPSLLLGYFERGQTITISGEQYLAFTSDSYWVVDSPQGVETMFGGARQAYIADKWLQPYREPALEKGISTEKSLPA